MQERITNASVSVEGRVYIAPKDKRHGAAIMEAIRCGELAPITQKMQGFWTSGKRHVDRYEAREIAVVARQIDDESSRRGKPLISEELW